MYGKKEYGVEIGYRRALSDLIEKTDNIRTMLDIIELIEGDTALLSDAAKNNIRLVLFGGKMPDKSGTPTVLLKAWQKLEENKWIIPPERY